MRRLVVLVVGLIAVFASGCGPTAFPVFRGGAFAKLERRVPLEDGERALVEPVEGTAMLGKIIKEPWDEARPLAEQLSENPCADELATSTRRTSAIATAVDAAPTRGAWLYYRVRVLERAEVTAKEGYAKCCAEKGCGVGHVRSLAFADGETSLASETLPGGRADVALDDPGAPLELELGNVRRVHGYFAFALAGDRAYLPPEPARPISDASYLAERMEVKDVLGNPDAYAFCSANECFSENGFVQRYRERTGSHELDDFDRDRAQAERVSGIVLGVLGLATIGLGVASVETADENKTRDEQDTARVAGGVGIGAGIIASTVGLTFAIAPRDGLMTEHFISRSDALRFVARFNRALAPKRSTQGVLAAPAPKSPPAATEAKPAGA